MPEWSLARSHSALNHPCKPICVPLSPPPWSSARAVLDEKAVGLTLVTFCVSCRRRKMYCGHARLCVCVCVCLSAAVRPHYYTDPDITCGHGRGCPLVVQYWADLQPGHGLRFYGNTAEWLRRWTRNSEVASSIPGRGAVE